MYVYVYKMYQKSALKSILKDLVLQYKSILYLHLSVFINDWVFETMKVNEKRLIEMKKCEKDWCSISGLEMISFHWGFV